MVFSSKKSNDKEEGFVHARCMQPERSSFFADGVAGGRPRVVVAEVCEPSRGKQLSQLRIPLFRFAKVAVRTYMYLVHARTLGLASSRAGGPRAVRSALNPKSGGGDCV